MHGGRGAIKSWGFARVAVMLANERRLRIACAREYQNSIAESVHETIVAQIDALNLGSYFNIQERRIRSLVTRSEFFFAGLKTNPRKFKSTEGIDILWIEEGESVSKESWEVVVPTVRKAGSEIWCGFNPHQKSDPTSQRFIENPHPLARVVEVNWRDNPWLSDELRAEKDYMARVDYDAYMHVWEGKYQQNSHAQVLSGKIAVEEFTPQKDWSGPYFGADWGFSQDPTAATKCWVGGRTLYIEREAWAIGCDLDKTPALFDRGLNPPQEVEGLQYDAAGNLRPECKAPSSRSFAMRADSARPETVSHMRSRGYGQIASVDKWKGSVEDGVAHLRQYERIVIHPRCKHAIEEGRLWVYKVDRLTQDVLPELVDANNHIWDAVRYALAPLIKSQPGIIEFYRREAEKLKQQQQAKQKQNAAA